MNEMERDMVIKLLRNHDIPYDYLDEVIEKHFKEKEWLINKLGLNEDNGYKLSFRLPTTEENRPEAVSFLKDIEKLTDGVFRYLDMSFMWQGKNKFRIAKAIKVAMDIYWILSEDDRYGFDDFRMMMHNAGLDYNTKSDDIARDVQVLSCYYGDFIKNGRVGWISANPYDYFTLSKHNCTFTSCVRVGGEYFNSVLHYLASDCMIPFYITEDNNSKKIGRCCMYVNNDLIASGRLFGSMFECDALIARDYIQNMFQGDWVVKGKIDREHVSNCSTAYVDYGYGVVTVRKGVENASVEIPQGRCLSCGCSLDTDEGGVCSDCHTGCKCERCGCGMNEDESYFIEDRDEYWCEYCVDHHATYCSRCGSVFSDSCQQVDGEDYFCERCRNKIGVSTCYDCDNLFTIDNMVNIEDINEHVCEDCADEYYHRCDSCGLFFSELDNDSGLCSNCLEERVVEDGTEEAVAI